MLQTGTQDRKVGVSKAQDSKGALIETQPVRGVPFILYIPFQAHQGRLGSSWTCTEERCCTHSAAPFTLAVKLVHVIDIWTFAGTRDFAPDDYRLRQWLFGEFEAVSRLFGFEQFETPVLESEELFVRKAGEEITQQLYNFEVRSSPCERDDML